MDVLWYRRNVKGVSNQEKSGCIISYRWNLVIVGEVV